MTKISNIIDEIVTMLDTIYGATHMKLKSPIIIENNEGPALDRGYGFYVEAGSNSQLLPARVESFTTQFRFTNTISNKGTDRDLVFFQTAMKQVLEDRLQMIVAFKQNAALLRLIDNIDYITDNGVEDVFTDEGLDHIMVQTIVTVEYTENINSY